MGNLILIIIFCLISSNKGELQLIHVQSIKSYLLKMSKGKTSVILKRLKSGGGKIRECHRNERFGCMQII